MRATLFLPMRTTEPQHTGRRLSDDRSRNVFAPQV